MKRIISLAIILILSLSFTTFAAYDEFVLLDTSVKHNATSVDATNRTITLYFSTEVSSGDVTIKEDNIDFTDYTSGANMIDAKKYEITFNNDLVYGATYEINFSDLKSLRGMNEIDLVGDFELIFTVEEAPEMAITSISPITGLGAGAVNEVSNFTADDSLQGALINFENYSSGNKDLTIVMAVYDSNGLVKKSVTSEKRLLPNSSLTIGVGTVIPSVTYDSVAFAGGKVKIFIWDNLSNKKPFIGSCEFEIQ